VAVKAAHYARPPGLGLDGCEHGDKIKVRRGSEYSIRTLQNADEKHGASTDFFNRCTWYLIPSFITANVLKRHLPPPYADHEYFICGPNVMMDAIEKALGEMNVPLSKYHSERYSFV
jgi:ferredoxin-NADP reductase